MVVVVNSLMNSVIPGLCEKRATVCSLLSSFEIVS